MSKVHPWVILAQKHTSIPEAAILKVQLLLTENTLWIFFASTFENKERRICTTVTKVCLTTVNQALPESKKLV